MNDAFVELALRRRRERFEVQDFETRVRDLLRRRFWLGVVLGFFAGVAAMAMFMAICSPR